MKFSVVVWISLVGAMGASTVRNSSVDDCNVVVFGHRGASGYVPEHTLGSYALAITMGADYVEPDLVMTRDGYLVARHENEISLSTDVASRPEFASRYRTQLIDNTQMTGWFTEDFTLAELKTLRAVERIPDTRPGNARMDLSFDIPTFQEIIDLVKGMEPGVNRTIGIVPEIKHPTHFQNISLAMERPLVDILHSNGYDSADSPIIIQSFEVNNLKQLKELTNIRLLQLYGSRSSSPYDQVVAGTGLTYGDMATAEGLNEVATYAYSVGPDKEYIIPRDSNNNLGAATTFVADAHAAGLVIQPYTFRAENTFLPGDFRSSDNATGALGNLAGELQAFIDAGIDGLFTDQPDIAARLVGGPCSKSYNSANYFELNAYLIFTLLLIKMML